MRILLMGNPNVGKSVVFSRLTGTSVTSSNYSGTTVEYTEGYMRWEGREVKIVDVPGTYTLDPTNRAEEVAVEMMEAGDLILNVVDSTNLERNLNLTLQLLERDIPVIVLLNMWDEARHRGIHINVDKLQEHLGVPVIPTVATTGEGFKEVVNYFTYRKSPEQKNLDTGKRWTRIGEIIEEVQNIEHRHHTFRDLFEELSIRPIPGIPLAFLILYISFATVRFVGEGIINYLSEPFFLHLYKPVIVKISTLLGSEGFLHSILVGQLIKGDIDFEQSFGVLTTGIFIPLAAVLPYIIAFYFILGLLEDTGYLPRLAVLVDNIMHRVGLHGFSIIPMILGLGCNVPAALAARTLESEREKFIASTLMAISIPCMAQSAMIIGLLGRYGLQYILYIYFFLFIIWIAIGLLMNKLLPGFSSDLLLEIPPLRLPSPGIIIKKLWMRVYSFLGEAIPYVLLGVLVVNLLYFMGIFAKLVIFMGPFFNKVLGLPREAIFALLMGFLRKDLAMGLLVPLDLTIKQLVIASTILTVYFPCAATFIVLVREMGIAGMVKAALIMIATAAAAGGFLNYTFAPTGLSLPGWMLIVLLFLLIKNIPTTRAGEKDIREEI